MRVLVVGSVRGEKDAQGVTLERPEAAEIRKAAHELGQCLAKHGHDILVGSDDPLDTDPTVVAGAVAAGKKGGIEVHLMQGANDCYPTLATAGTVENRRHRYADWDVTVLEVLRNRADAVIAIAGRVGVVQTGVAAWMMGRPVIPVASFDGGARAIWGYGSGERTSFYFGALSDEDIDGLNNSWNSGGPGSSAESIVSLLERVAKRANQARTPKPIFVGVSVSLLVALGVWVTLLAGPQIGMVEALVRRVYPPECQPNAECMKKACEGVRFVLELVSVCIAGALGALTQTMRAMRDGKPITSGRVALDALLGVVAGFLTSALYLIAQIAMGATLLPADDLAYARITLTVGLAAVFASLYLDTALARFDSLKDSVMAGKYGDAGKDGP